MFICTQALTLFYVWDADGTETRNDTIVEKLFESLDAGSSDDGSESNAKKHKKAKASKKRKRSSSSASGSSKEDSSSVEACTS